MGRKAKVPYNHESKDSKEATGIDVPALFGEKFPEFMEQRIKAQGETGTTMSVESEALEDNFTKRELCLILTRELSRSSRQAAQDPFQSFLAKLAAQGQG